MTIRSQPSEPMRPRQGVTLGKTLLVIDRQFSVLQALSAVRLQSNPYLPYGYSAVVDGRASVLAFNGELRSEATEHYSLGRGRREYNPFLMRFNSPDYFSPFHGAGINTYAFCLGDPVNAKDPSGNITVRTTAVVTHAAVRFKKGILPRVDGVVTWSTLPNKRLPELSTEVNFTSGKIEANAAHLTFVTGEKSLSRLSESGSLHKFVFTRDEKFFMGSFSSKKSEGEAYPSHASFGELGRLATGASDEIISAGYIWKEGGGYFIKNYSGHFRPSFQRMQPVQEHLRGLGIRVTRVRNDYVVKATDPI